jgi:ABC-type bacteriocin/lantibiotic exporter with double-glycine peptidase domain
LAGRQNSNQTIAEVYCDYVLPFAVNMLSFSLYLVVLFTYGVEIATIGIISAAVNIAILFFISQERKSAARRLACEKGKYEGHIAADLDMIETIKSCGSEQQFFEKWTGYAQSVYNSKNAIERKNLYTNTLPLLLSLLTDAAVLLIGIYEVFEGDFTVGALIAAQAFLAIFLLPISDFITSGTVVQSIQGQIEHVNDTMRYPSRVWDGNDLSEIQGNVKVENLCFSYNPLDEPFIKDLSFEVQKGKMTAFVGASGSGKSTVVKLIAGLYKPSSGKILFDGRDADEIDSDVIAEGISVVEQESTMFDGTVMSNINMWDETITSEEVISAAKDASIHDDIMKRKGGYQSKVSEGGINFSGGQCQRMEIARALAKQPKILILDEATGNLDAKTESMVMSAIKRRNLTCIAVAHRLSTIRDCDEILVFDDGKVVQRGTHDELKDVPGLYREQILSSVF